MKIPRCDIHGVGEDEVTVTSGLHAQAEGNRNKTEKREVHPREAQTKVRSRVIFFNHVGAPLVTPMSALTARGGIQ